jgi:hypothetical protein
LPDAPRELGRLLHAQADAALARVKLLQIASLPDAGSVARGDPPPVRVELPIVVGQQLTMVHLQIEREGAKRQGARTRGWTMRLAMNLAGTGEVGADVGLPGRTVNVALWAAEPDTAEHLNTMLPELTVALEAAGLVPGSIRCRSGLAGAAAGPQGQLLDAVS